MIMNKNVIIILLVILVALSAFFSCTEMAFAKINKVKLTREAANKKAKAAILANSFVEDYNDTITIILIGNNLVNIAASSLATILFVSINPTNGEWIATLVMTLGLMFYYAHQMCLGLMFLVPGIMVPMVLIMRKRRKLSRQSFGIANDVSQQLNQTLHGIKTIQAFAAEEREEKKFANVEDMLTGIREDCALARSLFGL